MPAYNAPMSEQKRSNLSPVSGNVQAGAGLMEDSAAARPAVVSLHYTSRKILKKAYMPFLKSGGLFFPTPQSYRIGDEVFLLVVLPEESAPVSVPGVVVWQTPRDVMGRRGQGVGIEFRGREGNALRVRIENLLDEVQDSGATYTM